MNQDTLRIRNKLTITQKKLSEEEHKKIDKTFELKFLTPPKFSAGSKAVEKNHSNSPPRYRNYENFSRIASKFSLNPNIVSFPYFHHISLPKLQETLLLKPAPKPKKPQYSPTISPSPPISIYQRHVKFTNIPSSSTKTLPSISPAKSQRSLPLIPSQKLAINKIRKMNPDILRKARSSLKHYKILSLESFSKSKIWEFFPGIPYGQENSKDFLKACKMGNHTLAENYLAVDPWLAHTFDYSQISAIHWGVIRGHLKVVQLLLRYKVWADVGDFVSFT